MCNVNKYLSLIKNNTPYAQRMNRLGRRIFGEVVRDTNKTSMRVVKIFEKPPFYRDDAIINYYPRYAEIHSLMRKLRDYGLFRDQYEDFKEEMARLRAIRKANKKL